MRRDGAHKGDPGVDSSHGQSQTFSSYFHALFMRAADRDPQNVVCLSDEQYRLVRPVLMCPHDAPLRICGDGDTWETRVGMSSKDAVALSALVTGSLQHHLSDTFQFNVKVFKPHRGKRWATLHIDCDMDVCGSPAKIDKMDCSDAVDADPAVALREEEASSPTAETKKTLGELVSAGAAFLRGHSDAEADVAGVQYDGDTALHALAHVIFGATASANFARNQKALHTPGSREALQVQAQLAVRRSRAMYIAEVLCNAYNNGSSYQGQISTTIAELVHLGGSDEVMDLLTRIRMLPGRTTAHKQHKKIIAEYMSRRYIPFIDNCNQPGYMLGLGADNYVPVTVRSTPKADETLGMSCVTTTVTVVQLSRPVEPPPALAGAAAVNPMWSEQRARALLARARLQHHLSLEHAHSFDIMNLTELGFSAITLAFKKAQPTYFASRDTVLHPSLPAAFGTHKDFKAQLHSVIEQSRKGRDVFCVFDIEGTNAVEKIAEQHDAGVLDLDLSNGDEGVRAAMVQHWCMVHAPWHVAMHLKKALLTHGGSMPRVWLACLGEAKFQGYMPSATVRSAADEALSIPELKLLLKDAGHTQNGTRRQLLWRLEAERAFVALGAAGAGGAEHAG